MLFNYLAVAVCSGYFFIDDLNHIRSCAPPVTFKEPIMNNAQILKVAGAYFLFGMLWIYFSDKLLHRFGPELEPTLQTYKGFIFISVTSVLLLSLLNIFNRKLNQSSAQIAWKDQLIEQREEENRYLEKLSSELKEANSDLQTFNYSISHDLKSPLRAINGYTEILFAKYDYRMDGEDRDIFAAIKNSIRRVDALINGLLMLSRADKKESDAEIVDMGGLFDEAVKENLKHYKGRHFNVKTGPLANCYADKMLLYQAVFNLLSNAFKYSDRNEHPEVTIGSNSDGARIVYYIKDNGCGFDMQYADKLFKPFERLHAIKDFEGTGLGLTIVKKIISKQGGTVWAESEPGRGSTFYFSLTAKQAA